MTPLMKQYWDIKNQHKDKILFFRMGDFYEMFHEDAVTAAPILNIALTSRNKKSQDDTPMCGLPHHSVAAPISKLLQAGYKVAICDQLEAPEVAKGIVKRGVTRILSPGMVYDPETLSELQANYIASYSDHNVSFLDATTGEAFYYRIPSAGDAQKIRDQLFALLQPVEVVITTQQKNDLYAKNKHSKENQSFSTTPLLIAGVPAHLTTFDYAPFDQLNKNENAVFDLKPGENLLAYAVSMQGESVRAILKPFEERKLSTVMSLNETVIRHLELFKTTKGDERGSLFQALNRTKTSAGARLLKSWMQFPLIDQGLIDKRLDKVEKWAKNLTQLKALRQSLQAMGDIERRLSKISYSNCNVHDLVALEQSLVVGLSLSPLCPELESSTLKALKLLTERIQNTLIEDPPVQTKNGGFIRKNYSQRLSELVTLAEESQTLLLELEQRERERTKINSLKVRYNNVFGYYIEITNTHTDKVPDDYKRKQTLANAERFITQELHELESKILSARSQRVDLEEEIFKDLCREILQNSPQIRLAAQVWSELDVTSSLAWLAIEKNYSRPKFISSGLKLLGSRHAVVEQEVQTQFVSNDIILNEGECLLLTGPNMAGKSTLMRQVAVTALMAQMGSFVACREAHLSVFDKIFTRIGASDSLTEGLSTFMVEMKETAEMLLEANSKSLVILDEVGRGTSTYDGMSLAQSILEYFVTAKKPLVFFATHYHELTQLENDLSMIKNAHMEIEESSPGQIRFLYALRPGPANKSYGLHVARLAGLPNKILKRAENLLSAYESQKAGRGLKPEATDDQSHVIKAADKNAEAQLSLDAFAFQQNDKLKAIADDLQDLQVSRMTPLAALNKISEWQQKLS